MFDFEYNEDFKIGEELYARAIGWMVLQHLKEENVLKSVPKMMENNALQILHKIKQILDDDSLDDQECFEQIEQIVETFLANGIQTTRHDWD